jgi:hypothetical protein
MRDKGLSEFVLIYLVVSIRSSMLARRAALSDAHGLSANTLTHTLFIFRERIANGCLVC